MPALEAAYGLFYLDARPTIVRALELTGGITGGQESTVLADAHALGFNACRVSTGLSADVIQMAGLVALDDGMRGERAHRKGPFDPGLQVARIAAAATEDEPAAIWGLRPDPGVILCAIARGSRAYSVALSQVELREIASDLKNPVRQTHAWIGAREEELTASVEHRDSLGYLDTHDRDDAPLHGAFPLLATAGFAPSVVNLETLSDAEIASFTAALLPTRGALDVDLYGKLVVLTLHGGTLVTFPQPVRTQRDETPLKTTYLWPRQPPAWQPEKPRLLRLFRQPPAERIAELGYRTQVRDGVSVLLATTLGEPYGDGRYARLPPSQRIAHRDLVEGLFADVVARSLVPSRELEVELVTRLSPDGGALIFVLNRLGSQAGMLTVPDPSVLNLSSAPSVAVELTLRGSTAEWSAGGIMVRFAAQDAMVLRVT